LKNVLTSQSKAEPSSFRTFRAVYSPVHRHKFYNQYTVQAALGAFTSWRAMFL